MATVIFGGALVAGHAAAQTAAWANLATTSGTLVPGSLCTTDGKDLTCDQSVSGLFQPDRITSGTTSMLVVSNTGYISVTQAGANTAWFDPTRGLVALGVSTTGVISGTGGYFKNTVNAPSLTFSDGTAYISGGSWNITLAGNVTMPDKMAVGTSLNNYYRIVTPEMTLVKGVTTGGMNLGAGLPQTMLDVQGSVRIATEISATRGVCDSSHRGAIRFVSSTASFDFCDGVNDWRSLAATAAAGMPPTDRITSGTTSMLAVSNTGYISVTQAGANTAWFDPTRGLVALGVSTTGVISGTGGYFTSAVKTLSIGSPSGNTAITFGNGSYDISIGAHVYMAGNYVFALGTPLNNQYRFATPELALYTPTKSLGIGTSTPQTLLDVNGSVRIAAEISATRGVCDSSHRGAIRFVSSTASFDFCDGVNDWRSLAATAAAGMSPTDRITSGTVGVVVSSTGIINFRTGGVTTGYFDAAGLLVAPGISITTASGISSTNGYFGGNVGIGTTQPSATLHVMGSILTSPQANSGTFIDWSKGNTQSTTASCGTFTFTNMQDGGVYSLAVKGAGADTCSFSQSGLNFRMPPDHGPVSAGTMTLYRFTRSGSDVFVNWTAGY